MPGALFSALGLLRLGRLRPRVTAAPFHLGGAGPAGLQVSRRFKLPAARGRYHVPVRGSRPGGPAECAAPETWAESTGLGTLLQLYIETNAARKHDSARNFSEPFFMPFVILITRLNAFTHFENHGPEAKGERPGNVERRRAHRGSDSASAGRAARAACPKAGSFKCSWEERSYKAGSLSSYGTAHDGY
jgi:hypothetical protein